MVQFMEMSDVEAAHSYSHAAWVLLGFACKLGNSVSVIPALIITFTWLTSVVARLVSVRPAYIVVESGFDHACFQTSIVHAGNWVKKQASDVPKSSGSYSSKIHG